MHNQNIQYCKSKNISANFNIFTSKAATIRIHSIEKLPKIGDKAVRVAVGKTATTTIDVIKVKSNHPAAMLKINYWQESVF